MDYFLPQVVGQHRHSLSLFIWILLRPDPCPWTPSVNLVLGWGEAEDVQDSLDYRAAYPPIAHIREQSYN